MPITEQQLSGVGGHLFQQTSIVYVSARARVSRGRQNYAEDFYNNALEARIENVRLFAFVIRMIQLKNR